jgi:hypothetical protein
LWAEGAVVVAVVGEDELARRRRGRQFPAKNKQIYFLLYI